MANEEIDKERRKRIIPALRKASRWWVYKTKARIAAKVSPGIYKCAGCNESYSEKETQVDHIAPIVPVKSGFTTWDDYINRLFCDINNLQILCLTCHESKTQVELEQRKIYKKKAKKVKK